MGLIGLALSLRPELPSRPAPSYPLLELCTGLPDSGPPSRVAHTLPSPPKGASLRVLQHKSGRIFSAQKVAKLLSSEQSAVASGLPSLTASCYRLPHVLCSLSHSSHAGLPAHLEQDKHVPPSRLSTGLSFCLEYSLPGIHTDQPPKSVWSLLKHPILASLSRTAPPLSHSVPSLLYFPLGHSQTHH